MDGHVRCPTPGAGVHCSTGTRRIAYMWPLAICGTSWKGHFGPRHPSNRHIEPWGDPDVVNERGFARSTPRFQFSQVGLPAVAWRSSTASGAWRRADWPWCRLTAPGVQGGYYLVSMDGAEALGHRPGRSICVGPPGLKWTLFLSAIRWPSVRRAGTHSRQRVIESPGCLLDCWQETTRHHRSSWIRRGVDTRPLHRGELGLAGGW